MDLLCTHCGAVILEHRPEQPTGQEIAAAIGRHEKICSPVPAQRRAPRPAPSRA